MKKLSYKGSVIGLVITSIFLVCSILIAILAPVIDKQNEQSQYEVTEFSATVVKVEQNKNDYLITVEEYEFKLVVINQTVISSEAIKNLVAGEQLYFSIPTFVADAINDMQFQQLSVYTLRTSDTDIVTLESFKKYMDNQRVIVQYTSIIFAVIFALIAGFFIYRIVRVRLLKSKN